MLLKMLKKSDVIRLLDLFPLFLKEIMKKLEGEDFSETTSEVSEKSRVFGGVPMGSIRHRASNSNSSVSNSESSESEESVHSIEIREPANKERRMTVD
jgi:DNA-binding ferritin-like protein